MSFFPPMTNSNKLGSAYNTWTQVRRKNLNVVGQELIKERLQFKVTAK